MKKITYATTYHGVIIINWRDQPYEMSCSTYGHVRFSFYETLVGTAHCEDSKLNKQSADIGKQRISLILFPYTYVPQQRIIIIIIINDHPLLPLLLTTINHVY